MKSLLLTVALLGGSPAVAAEDVFCRTFGEVAGTFMKLRQMDAPLSDMIDMLEEGPARALMIEVIMDAYSRPSYSTPSNQQEAIDEFRNDWELQCYLTKAN